MNRRFEERTRRRPTMMVGEWSTATRMSLYALLIVALFHTVLADGRGRDQQSIDDHDERRFLTKRSVRVCGIKLVDMMKKVCNHCYKTRKHEQQQPHELAKRNAAQGSLRAIVAILDEDDTPVTDEHQNNNNDEVRRGLDALDMFIDKRWGGDTRRPRHQSNGGIANKCCLNQCSYSDLVSYCCTTASP